MTEKELLASLSAKANEESNNNSTLAQSNDNSENISTQIPENNSSNSNADLSIDETIDETAKRPSNENSSGETPITNEVADTVENIDTSDNTVENPQEISDILHLSEADMVEKGELPAKRDATDVAENSSSSQEEVSEEEEEEEPMSLLDHLKELRRRLTRVVIVVLIGFIVCYPVAEMAYHYLSLPLQINLPEGSTLIYTSPAGAFFVYLKIALVLSFFASSPYSFYQIWAFVAPGLYKEEKKMLMPLAACSAFFFMSGAAFCYFLVFPIAFEFFMGFATDAIVPMISIEEYLSFVLKLLIAFGLVFEMPLFAFFLGRMGLLTVERMRKWRKYAILLCFIVAALLTPPDVFSQTLMAGPMIILYEVSVLIVAMVQRQKAKEKALLNAENEEEQENTENS